jgi:hypothetical protein
VSVPLRGIFCPYLMAKGIMMDVIHITTADDHHPLLVRATQIGWREPGRLHNTRSEIAPFGGTAGSGCMWSGRRGGVWSGRRGG